jgi:hypothetical protein
MYDRARRADSFPPPKQGMSYEEEDTCMSYEEEDTCMTELEGQIASLLLSKVYMYIYMYI